MFDLLIIIGLLVLIFKNQKTSTPVYTSEHGVTVIPPTNTRTCLEVDTGTDPDFEEVHLIMDCDVDA